MPLAVPPSAAKRRPAWVRGAMAAAAVAVITGGVIQWRGHVVHRPASVAVREYVTARGQRAELMLDDGTRVWLNVASRLRVSPGYGTRTRDVELDGEAYFAVAHDATRPFRVRARHALAEDLGTEFSVRAYPDDREVAVTVASGLVALRADSVSHSVSQSGDATLGRGQAGRLDRHGHVAVTDDVDVGAALAWRAGELKFAERPLAEVVPELERWYDLDIVVEDSALARVPITASIGRRTGDQALAIIARILDARYVRDGRRVRLTTDSAGP